MTVGSQLKGTLAALHNASGTLGVYASKAGEEEAQGSYRQGLEEIHAIIKDLEERLKVLEYAEPQYKGL